MYVAIRCNTWCKCLTGKYYYEVQITDEGLCRVGFSTDTAVYDVGMNFCPRIAGDVSHNTSVFKRFINN